MEVCDALTSQLGSRARPDGMDGLRLVGEMGCFPCFFRQIQAGVWPFPVRAPVYSSARKTAALWFRAIIET